jgi:hypothetical protein
MVALEADPNWLVPALLQVAMDATDDATADAAVTAVTEQVADHFTTKVAAPSADAWLNWSIAHMSRLDPESPIVTRRFERLCAAMPRSPANGPTLADVAADTERVPATRRAAALKALWRYPLSPQVQSVDLLASYLTTATPEELFETTISVLRVTHKRICINEVAVTCMPALLASATTRPAAATAAMALLSWYSQDQLAQLAAEVQRASHKHINCLRDRHAPWESRLGVCELLYELVCSVIGTQGLPAGQEGMRNLVIGAMDMLAEASDSLSRIATPHAAVEHAVSTEVLPRLLQLLGSFDPPAESNGDEAERDDAGVAVPQPDETDGYVDDGDERAVAEPRSDYFAETLSTAFELFADSDDWKFRRAAAAATQCFSDPRTQIPSNAVARLLDDPEPIVWLTALQAPLDVLVEHLPTITRHVAATLRDHSNATLHWVILQALATVVENLKTRSVVHFASTEEIDESIDVQDYRNVTSETAEEDEEVDAEEQAEKREDATEQTDEATARHRDHVPASIYVVREWIPVVSEVMNRTANPFTFAAAGNLLALLCHYHCMRLQDGYCLNRRVVLRVFDSTMALLQADEQRFQPAAVRLTTLAGDEAGMTDSVYDEVAAACALSAVHVELLSVVIALVSEYKEFIPTARVMELFRLIRAQGMMSAAAQSVLRFYNFFVKAFPERVAGVIGAILPHLLTTATSTTSLSAGEASVVPRLQAGASQMVCEGAAALNTLLEWAVEFPGAATRLDDHAFDLVNAVMALSRYPLVNTVQEELATLHRSAGELIMACSGSAATAAMLGQLIHVALRVLRKCYFLSIRHWEMLSIAIRSNARLIDNHHCCRNAGLTSDTFHLNLADQAVSVMQTAVRFADDGIDDAIVILRLIKNTSSVVRLALRKLPNRETFNRVLSKMRQLVPRSAVAHYARLTLAQVMLAALRPEVEFEFTAELVTMAFESAVFAVKTSWQEHHEAAVILHEVGSSLLRQIGEANPDPSPAFVLPLTELLQAPMKSCLEYLQTSIARKPHYAKITGLAVLSLLREYATVRLPGVDTVELAETVLSVTVAHLPLTTDNEELRGMVYGALVILFGDGTLASSQVSAELKARIARSVLLDETIGDDIKIAMRESARGSRSPQGVAVPGEPRRKRHNSRR